MKSFFQAVYYAFCGLVFALSVTVLISMSVWLDMRVHNEQVFIVFLCMGVVYSFFVKKIQIKMLFVSEIFLYALSFLFNKQDLIYYNLRDFYLDSFSFSQIKFLFLAILFLSNIFLILMFVYKREIFTNK